MARNGGKAARVSKLPNILAVETSGRRGSLALAVGDERIDEIGFATDRERARDLLPCADELVKKHGVAPTDIDQVYISNGPGSFTGLRIAVTFARHMALATGAKVRAVPTLDVIAANALSMATPPGCVIPMLDAKKDQVFGAVYLLTDGEYQCVVPAQMVEPVALVESLLSAGQFQSCVLLGEGLNHHLAKFDDLVKAECAIVGAEPLWWPHASRVIEIGRKLVARDGFTDANRLVPDYVRRPEAEEIWEKRFGK